MPGRIDMDQQGEVGTLDLKKDRSHAQIAQSAPAVHGDGGQQVNGVLPSQGQNGSLPDGHNALAEAPAATNGEVSSSMRVLDIAPNAPPLDQSWCEGFFNMSFGKLLGRVSHDCFVKLQETLTRMSDIQEQTQRPQVNGAQKALLDPSEASLAKKKLLMEFAQSQRDNFIKALVLTDASRNEAHHNHLITVSGWQRQQAQAFVEAREHITATKLDSIMFKQASPNIEVAMEVLSTSKASGVPHLGYIPPEKATAKELLKTLRDMNVILATRLSLDDDLSPHMRDYTIANGRVTFRVPGEFEVDLSAVEEDAHSQFFFLDLRLAFTPSTGVLSDVLRSHLDARVNHALMEKGLPGCYDFLHNFVLTHKISVLRSQVTELTQGKWFECIRAENLRRSLSVQYWTGKRGPKSWLEFGISSGKGKDTRSRKTPTPCLSVRWFRQGVEITDELPEFDWSELNLERCLSAVIERHVAWIFGELRTRVRDLAPSERARNVRFDEVGGAQETLAFSSASLGGALRLKIDSVTGLYSLSPPSGPTARAERHLNNDSTADPAQWLANTICALGQEKVHKIAELLQWAPVPGLARQDDLHKLFGPGLRAHSTFVPRKAWGEQWALAVTFDLAGETWWAVSFAEKRNEDGSITSKIIQKAQRLKRVSDVVSRQSASRAKLLYIARCAVAEVAFGALSAQLKSLQIPHHLEPPTPTQDDDAASARRATQYHAMLYFDPRALLRLSGKKAGVTWTTNFARLTHRGMVEDGSDRSRVRYDLRLALESGKVKYFERHLTIFKDRNLVFNTDGAVSLRIFATFGKPFADQLRSRMQSIERIDRYLHALQKYRLRCTQVSLSRLSIAYSSEPELGAAIIFPQDDEQPASLKLQPSDINPHSRIKALLENGMNSAGDNGIEAMTFILQLTLPLLQALERTESVHKTTHAVTVLPRTATRYLVKYRPPLPTCSFAIQAHQRKQGKTKMVVWHVQLRRDGSALADELTKALKEDLWDAKGDHWRGIGNGLLASAAGIGQALDRLDGIVRRFEGSAVQSTPPNASGPPSQANGELKTAENHSQPVSSQTQTQAQPPKPPKQQQQQQRSTSNSQSKPVKKEEPDVIMLD